jgi:hypothetical protein
VITEEGNDGIVESFGGSNYLGGVFNGMCVLSYGRIHDCEEIRGFLVLCACVIVVILALFKFLTPLLI